MKSNYSIFLILIILIYPVNIYSQIDNRDSLLEHNHEGFFLRILAGLSYSHWESDMDIKNGGAIDYRLQAGWGLSQDLVLYGNLGGMSLFVQRFSVLSESGSSDNTHVEVYDFGAGLSYYFMPSDIYLSLCGLLTWSNYEFNAVRKGESETGYGLFLSAGKDVWVSEDVSLGGALFYTYGSIKDKTEFNKQGISTYSIGILFSATLF